MERRFLDRELILSSPLFKQTRQHIFNSRTAVITRSQNGKKNESHLSGLSALTEALLVEPAAEFGTKLGIA